MDRSTRPNNYSHTEPCSICFRATESETTATPVDNKIRNRVLKAFSSSPLTTTTPFNVNHIIISNLSESRLNKNNICIYICCLPSPSSSLSSSN